MRSCFILLLLSASLFATSPSLAQGQERSDEQYVRDRVARLVEQTATGQARVTAHDSLIVLHAEAHEVDPDWLRAIIMAEATRLPEDIGDRVAPTGIDAVEWVGLDDATVESFSDPSENIRLAALLLRRILDRLPEGNQSLRVVASLYDDIATNSVTPYGMLVEQAYSKRWWEPEDGAGR